MRLARLGFAAAVVFFAGGAAAQSPASDAVDPWKSDPPSSAATPSPNDVTAEPRNGVVLPPGAKIRKAAPVAPKITRKAAPAIKTGRRGAPAPGETVAWFPGFLRLENGMTRVFLEVSKRAEVTEHRAQGRLTYRLKNVYTPDPTNRLPLLTGWISTPVERVQLVEAGPDADLVIELRQTVEPTFRILDTPRGMVLQVDFPAIAIKERDPGGENGMPIVPNRARLKSSSTRIEGGDSSF